MAQVCGLANVSPPRASVRGFGIEFIIVKTISLTQLSESNLKS
jgi:hypothetical protein